MDLKNYTVVTEFILLGLSRNPKTQVILFVIFLLGYLIILIGNILIIGLILTDTNLQTSNMYFFLFNLSFLDICFSTTTVPRMLRDLMSVKKIITYAECATQLYICLSLGEIECILLAVMAYNRYIAICYPLHYTTIMSRMACVRIAVSTWICGFVMSILHVAVILNVDFCGNNEINDFLCEVPELLSISCENESTIFIEGITYVVGVIVLMIPVTFIVVSYIKIISSILKITSSAGRRKAFSTCGSHIIVVTMFYGSVMTAYMKPRSSLTPETDKVNTVFYCVVTPMFNPIIYTLRNNDVKSAFLKVRKRHSFC